ncbi:endoplasmic reticulum-Golgi intermediate compartment protein 2 [Lingula anatina]|uniref:Endoplasmic reticulum-Golgi intermediate compartment protein 2 n=1 Tax=Lingula anatina TaxID=7574 RepID=A0A2R2MLP5_LINAN|nr:endoplasmic reticulum-Golgi intermediate compartment protein 2 [Lingula anatina]|eukprot:XP_023931125.1 endoplasmic reticulum-Golgi intermediate compartment protein 2 [Lingula anatina]
MLRLNVAKRKQAINVVKELDAFPKVPEDYVEKSSTGGGISVITFAFILVLIISEIRYYSSSDLRFSYEVDTEFDKKLQLNIDMTVAMRCSAIGADIVDQTGQNIDSFGSLEEEDVHFELSPDQRTYQEMLQHVNSYMRDEYHAIQDFIWKTGYSGIGEKPIREVAPSGPRDSCRLHGSFILNKVAGNFHVTVGRSVPVIPRGHAHLAIMVEPSEYNFTHRIDTFSFGTPTPGVINPLDGDEIVTTDNRHVFQYYIKVVPTTVQTLQSNIDTYQYAVTMRNRTINHSAGSHGTPGIFVKYDMSPIKVKVTEERRPIWEFLVRLCAIVGGIFATSGIIHNVSGFLVDLICCRYKIGKYTPVKRSFDSAPQQSVPSCNLSTDDLTNSVPQVSLVPGGQET